MDLSVLDDTTIISLNQAKQLFGRVPEVMEIIQPLRDAFDDDAPSIELGLLLDRCNSQTLSVTSLADFAENPWPPARKRVTRKSTRLREPISPALRFKVFQRDGYRCQLCGATAATGARLEADHKVALSKGGPTSVENLWTLCFACNRGKRDRSL